MIGLFVDWLNMVLAKELHVWHAIRIQKSDFAFVASICMSETPSSIERPCPREKKGQEIFEVGAQVCTCQEAEVDNNIVGYFWIIEGGDQSGGGRVWA
jgi:hypothetical protein